MPGFFASNMGYATLRNARPSFCRFDSIELDGIVFSRNTLERFMEDKCFTYDDSVLVVAEGVLLNKSELFETEKCLSIFELVKKLYEQSDTFFDVFRGSFSGIVWDRKRKKLIAFTNHVGDSSVFYYIAGSHFAIGSQPNYILDVMKANNINLSLDFRAIYSMTSYAFMTNDSTYASEVKRLLPGHYIKVLGGAHEVKEYWRVKSQRNNELAKKALEEKIVEFDELFRRAVKREFGKDAEYGYRHVCDLSGGLDSRMVTWVAHDMGYIDQLNITYCQSGYTDEIVATKIAARLGHELLFKPLDDIGFMFEAERLVEMNYGLSLYSGITGGESLLRAISWDEIGLEHTGQLGGNVLGSYLTKERDDQPLCHAGQYSNYFIDRIPAPSSVEWENEEQFMLSVRGMLGILSTHLIRRNFTEVSSPFLDVDVLDYCMSIPIQERAKHTFYINWMRACYPDAASFVWEKTGVAPSASQISACAVKAERGIKRRVFNALGVVDKSGMNPTAYWEKVRPDLTVYLDSQFMNNIDVLGSIAPELVDCFNDATLIEKTQFVTAVLGAKYFMGYGRL